MSAYEDVFNSSVVIGPESIVMKLLAKGIPNNTLVIVQEKEEVGGSIEQIVKNFQTHREKQAESYRQFVAYSG